MSRVGLTELSCQQSWCHLPIYWQPCQQKSGVWGLAGSQLAFHCLSSVSVTDVVPHAGAAVGKSLRARVVYQGWREGRIHVFQERICIPFQVLFLQIKKKKKKSTWNWLFKMWNNQFIVQNRKKKNHSKPCKHLFNAFGPVTSYAGSVDLSIGYNSFPVWSPCPWKMLFKIVLSYKINRVGRIFSHIIPHSSCVLSPNQWKSIRVFAEWIQTNVWGMEEVICMSLIEENFLAVPFLLK